MGGIRKGVGRPVGWACGVEGNEGSVGILNFFYVIEVNLLDIKGFGLKLDAFMGVMLNMRLIKP